VDYQAFSAPATNLPAAALTSSTEASGAAPRFLGANWIQEAPIPGQVPSTTVEAAEDLSATIASGMAGVAGLVPAFWAVTAMTVEESENTALSVPSILYLSSLPVTVAAHLNPRVPVF
jgi:hypothetical protein